MKQTILIITILLTTTFLFAQSDTIPEPFFDSRTHFSGKKGKWNFSGQRLYKDSVLFYSDVYGSVYEDSTVYYLEKTWFYPNGQKKRYIYVDFKKSRRARIIDKSFSESGELTEDVSKKAKRLPEQNDPTKVEWLEKKQITVPNKTYT
jgi:hypothetical protein